MSGGGGNEEGGGRGSHTLLFDKELMNAKKIESQALKSASMYLLELNVPAIYSIPTGEEYQSIKFCSLHARGRGWFYPTVVFCHRT